MKLNVKIPDGIGFQLAPMLDVVFLLLIFFVVTQRIILNEQDLKVKVPTAPKSTEEVARAIDEIIINARTENDELVITIDREQFTKEALSTLLERMHSHNAQLPVRIRADADMSWQKVADVISICTKAGVWNVSFSSKQPSTQQTQESQ